MGAAGRPFMQAHSKGFATMVVSLATILGFGNRRR